MSTETFLTTVDVDRIRADERRATVERIREWLLREPLLDGTPIGSSRISAFNVDIAAILDAEAER
jgi:hypothetical protein